MGRSRNKTRVRQDSNRRLRSGRTRTHPAFAPSRPVDLVDLARRLQSPSYYPQSQRLWRPNAPARTPPTRQPPRQERRRLRSTSPLSTGVWHEVGAPVSRPPSEDRPEETVVCVRRSQRREVLHALRKTGKAGQKSPKYNRQSKIHCKK